MCSIASDFQFSSYKIDHLQLDIAHNLATIDLKGLPDGQEVQFEIGIRNPSYSQRNQLYIGGLNVRAYAEQETSADENGKIFDIRIGAAGIFRVTGRMEKELEDNLVKFRIPTLLLPILRAGITVVLGTAGFGGVMLPLINLAKMIGESDKPYEVQIID